MNDDDLTYLHGILCRMDGDEEVKIGLTHWTVSDIAWLVEQAMQARAYAAELPEPSQPQ